MAIQYYMRGYNTSAPGTVGYVDWVVNDIPDSTALYVPSPYLSGNITNITVNRVVTSKVDNFLKPFSSLSAIGGSGNDGYFFHLNSYDWLNSTPPGPPIPTPSYLTGLSVVRGSVDGVTPRDYATLFWSESATKWIFAYNTNGDGTTIGSSLPVGIGSISIDGYIEVGLNPSESGIIRLPNNEFIVSRNASNTGDGYLIGQDDLDRVRLGSPPGNQIYIPGDLRLDGYLRDGGLLPSTSGFIRNNNGTEILSFRDFNDVNNCVILSTDGSTNTIYVGDTYNEGISYNTGALQQHSFKVNDSNLVHIGNANSTTYINFDKSSAFPTISQATATVGNGQDLKIKAQTASSEPSTGGSLVLASGQGFTSDGYVDIRANNTPKVRVFGSTVPVTSDYSNNSGSNPNSIQVFNPTIRWYNTVTSPTITQDPLSVLDAENMLILAQSATGISYKGGDLELSSGSSNSSSKDGYVKLQTGQIDRLVIDSTADRITQTLSTFAFNGLDGTFDAAAITNPVITQRNDITNSVTGQLLTVKAQTTTGTNSIGGSLNISSGNGTTADGYVRVLTGSTTRMLFDATANRNTFSLREFAFNGLDGESDQSNIINPIIKQRNDNNSSATGNTLTLQSQSAPVSGVGGNLLLSTGLGGAIAAESVNGPAYTRHGRLFLQTGSVDKIGEFFVDGYGPYLSIGGTTSSPAAIDGYVRVPNNTWAVSADRNSSPSPSAQSIHLIGSNSDDEILIGNQYDTARINGQVFLGTYDSINTVEAEPRLIRTNFNNPEVGVPVDPPTRICGLVVHRGNDGTPTYNNNTGVIWTEGGYPTVVSPSLNASDGYWRFASILQGNTSTLDLSLNVMARALSVTEHPNSVIANNPEPTDGTLPTVGGLRTLSTSTAVSARNAASSQNLLLLGTDASDRIVLGGSSSPYNTGFIFNAASNSVYDFQVNSTSNKVMIGDGYVRFGSTPSTIGSIRHTQTANASTDILTTRSANNSTNVSILGIDGYDRIVHGTVLNKGHLFNTAVDGYYQFNVNSSTTAYVDGYRFSLIKGLRRNINRVSTTYNVLPTDDFIAVSAGSTFTITLPASPLDGTTYIFKDIDGTSAANNVTIDGNGANIDGSATLPMNSNYMSFTLTYTGSQWSRH